MTETFTYDDMNRLTGITLKRASGQDCLRIAQPSVTSTKRYFTPLYETETKNGVTKNMHYLTTTTGIFAIFVTQNGGGGTMYYTLKDHQGSLAAVVYGSTVERLSYDPWGRRRNTTNFGYDNVNHTFDRGYTLHEHYDAFDLINMNGRLYDPILGRMLSPDIVIQDEQSSQAYNRYAYCMYNPLSYVDPSGWKPRKGVVGYTPNSADYARDYYDYAEHAYEPRDFRNAYYMYNTAFYGKMGGPGGSLGSEGGYYGSYGYQVTHCANSVYNYHFLSTMLALIQNWQSSPTWTTGKELKEAGISNLTVGEVYGSIQGNPGFRNSYYTWTDKNGNIHTAAALYEYVGGNANGTFAVSNQPLWMYGTGNTMTNNAMRNAMAINSYINSGSTLVGKGAEWAKLTVDGTKVSKEVEAAVLLGRISKGSKVLGAVGLTINFGSTYVQIKNGYISWQEGVVRFGMSVAELGLAKIPYVGPILSIGVTAYDIGGGFDNNLYNTDNWWK